LISANLPAAIEDLSGLSVPPSLLSKAATVRQYGGIEYISRLNTELPQLLQRNRELLDQASVAVVVVVAAVAAVAARTTTTTTAAAIATMAKVFWHKVASLLVAYCFRKFGNNLLCKC